MMELSLLPDLTHALRGAVQVFLWVFRMPSQWVVFDIKTERVLRYIELGGFGPGYGVALTPDKKRLYIPLGVPAQSAVAVVDAKTLTIVANIVDTDLDGPRLVRFTNY